MFDVDITENAFKIYNPYSFGYCPVSKTKNQKRNNYIHVNLCKLPFLSIVMDGESNGMLFMVGPIYNMDFNKVKTSKVNLESICYL